MPIRLALVALLTIAATAAAQNPAAPALAPVPVPTAQFDSAYYAWQVGNYPDALQRFEKMLTGPRAADLLEPVALATGELFQTTELAPDGFQLRWSRDGKLLAFTSAVGSTRNIHLTSVAAAPKEVA